MNKKILLFLFFLIIIILLIIVLFFRFFRPNTYTQASQQDLYNCGKLDQPNTTYILKNDINTIGSCFQISKDNISLDLGGHALIYGESKSSCTDSNPYSCAGVSTFGQSRVGFRIFNGKIKQSPDGGAWSPAIWGNNFSDSEISNLEIEVNGPDSGALSIEWGGLGLNIHHNNIINTSTYVSDRHNVNGSIKIERSKGNLRVYQNTINGGPQAGIFISSHNSELNTGFEVFHNQVRHDERYTNGYGIHFYQIKSGSVYENTIIPTFGRGISIELAPLGSNIAVSKNNIEVKCRKQILKAGLILDDYNPYLTHGIKIESSFGVSVFENNILALANSETGHANALDLNLPTNAKVSFWANTFQAQTSDPTKYAAVIYANDTATDSATIFNNNILSGNNRLIFIDWSGAGGMTFRSNTFRKGASPVNFKTLYFNLGDSSFSQNNLFIDTDLEDGASLEDIYFQAGSSRVEFKVGWFINLQLVDNLQLAIPNVQIQVQSPRYNGQTTAGLDGKVRLELIQYQRIGSSVIDYNPYQITFLKAGFITKIIREVIIQSSDRVISLDPEIILSKYADKIQARTGDLVKYTITYTNRTDRNLSVEIKDRPPENTWIIPQSITGGGVISGDQIIWQIINIPPGQSGEVSFQVKIL